jgi:hypothetical protein
MRTTTLAAFVLALAGPLPAQVQGNLYSQASIVGGVEARQYSFGDNFGVDRVRQVAMPVGAVVPLGKRFSLDIGSAYAITTVVRPSGSESFSSFTDTQIRASYLIGNDALVASVMMNLPTGEQTTTLRDFNTASSASSNFLLFPVNSYGAGFSVTPGLAAATTVGSWNLGAAASVRVSSSYSPFSDTASAGVKYEPGVETRLRAGADRLVGSSRLTLGFTFSTFSNDELRGGSLGSGSFDPGNRVLIDVGLLSPVRGGTVGVYVWNYYRGSSGASGKEDVFTAGASGNFALSPKISLEPVAEARIWSPRTGSGILFGAGTALRVDVSPHVSLVPGARVDFGTIRTPSDGSNSVTGWDLSALIRYGF